MNMFLFFVCQIYEKGAIFCFIWIHEINVLDDLNENFIKGPFTSLC